MKRIYNKVPLNIMHSQNAEPDIASELEVRLTYYIQHSTQKITEHSLLCRKQVEGTSNIIELIINIYYCVIAHYIIFFE